jgi:hypothetical protein
LTEEYGYRIQEIVFRTRRVGGFAVYLCSQNKILSMDIDEQQKAFILAKVHNYLEITERFTL